MMNDQVVTKEMLALYNELTVKKKEVEKQIDELKKAFNDYFDVSIGKLSKGELTIGEYKLQRQIRKIEKYVQDDTVKKLEALNLNDLIKKQPDEKKIKSAIELGLLSEEELADFKQINHTQAIVVKRIK